MSNHTIKAKTKSNGEIVEFRVEKDYWIRGEYYSKDSFNDLFEVIEDKKCSSSVVDSVAGQDTNTLKKEKWMREWDSKKEEWVDKIDIDTLKKEESMQERFNKQFMDEDTGLLNIGKYDHEEVIRFIEGEVNMKEKIIIEKVKPTFSIIIKFIYGWIFRKYIKVIIIR